MNKLSQAYNYHTLPKAKPVNPVCNFCNNTDSKCCPEADKNQLAEQAKIHVIDPQDEHHHDEADAHVFMLNGLLVAKDVAMPKAGV